MINFPGVLSALAGKLLERMEKNSSEHIHADSMAFGLICDKMFEMIDKADAMKDTDPDYKKHYPTPLLMNLLLLISDGFNRRTEKDLRMANSWLGKGLGKMQMLQEKRHCVNVDMLKCWLFTDYLLLITPCVFPSFSLFLTLSHPRFRIDLLKSIFLVIYYLCKLFKIFWKNKEWRWKMKFAICEILSVLISYQWWEKEM